MMFAFLKHEPRPSGSRFLRHPKRLSALTVAARCGCARRALTLVELLASLVLLSAISIAAGAWLAASVRSAADAANRAAWRGPAESALRLIVDDLRIGDLERAAEPDEEPPPKISAGAASPLRIISRDAHIQLGPVVHEYHFDDRAHRLWRITRAAGPVSARPHERILLGEVESFTAIIDDETGLLRLRIESKHSRNFSVETEVRIW